MAHFNFNRFLNVARWDLNVNRSFYINLILVMLGATCLPVLFDYLAHFCDHGFGDCGRRCVDASWSYSEINSSTIIHMVIAFLAGWVLVFVYGFIFHNLRDKRGRVAELTLPSSNLERFLWHALVVVVGAQMVFVVSIVAADVLNVILSGLVCGHNDSFFITRSVLLAVYDDIPQVLLYDGESLHILQYMVGPLAAFLGMSIYALGNALKYRYNIAYTILFYIAMAFLLGASLGAVFAISDQFKFSVDISLGENEINALLVAVLVGLICLTWWLTYRLYCRAQITSPRNR